MKKLCILFILLLLIIGGTYLWWIQSLMPVDPQNKTTQIFVVKNGEGIRELSTNLKQTGLIKNSIAFFLLVKQKNYDGKIQAGDFRLSSSMSTQQIAENLTHGILDIWVTIPEGIRAEEIAQTLKSKMPNYQDTWQAQLKSNEGYLFPDTYQLPREALITNILPLFKQNFDRKYGELQKAPTNTLTDQQVIIVASLVEREAKFPEDRPLIASVIINRLKINMALQIDSTIQYALGYQSDTKTWWKKALTSDDLQLKSPYNTYLNTGLPPTPICNPGQAALQAALNPASTDYLYYIADKTGHSHFAKTLAGHNKNIQQYGL